MPVVQLEDNSGANLGSALGAVGGYLATKKTRDADKATAAADKARTNAREDSAAALNAKKVQGEIDATQHKSQTDDASALEKARQQHVFEQLSETVKDGPPKGMDPRMWAAQLQNQANASGLTDEKLRNQLIATGQAVVAARAPKLADVTHGIPQLPVAKAPGKDGKGGVPGATPEQVSKHYLDAAARVLNSDLPEDQKKLGIEQFQKMAADALAGKKSDETERHNRATEVNQGKAISTRITIAGMPARSGGGGGGYNSDLQPRAQAIEQQAMGAKDIKGALKILEGANLPRRDRTEVRQDIMDQFKAPPMGHDTSGLSNAGKEAFSHDMASWATSGLDPEKQPNPDDPKYQKRTAALGNGGGGAPPAPAAKPVMHNGKPYYLHTDGNYYLTP